MKKNNIKKIIFSLFLMASTTLIGHDVVNAETNHENLDCYYENDKYKSTIQIVGITENSTLASLYSFIVIDKNTNAKVIKSTEKLLNWNRPFVHLDDDENKNITLETYVQQNKSCPPTLLIYKYTKSECNFLCMGKHDAGKMAAFVSKNNEHAGAVKQYIDKEAKEGTVEEYNLNFVTEFIADKDIESSVAPVVANNEELTRRYQEECAGKDENTENCQDLKEKLRLNGIQLEFAGGAAADRPGAAAAAVVEQINQTTVNLCETAGIGCNKDVPIAIGPWVQGCGIFGEKGNEADLAYYVQMGLNYFKFIAPILLILLGMLDFGKAIISNDADALKKAGINFSKRLIAAVILFLLPVIINFIMDMIDVGTYGTCNFN